MEAIRGIHVGTIQLGLLHEGLEANPKVCQTLGLPRRRCGLEDLVIALDGGDPERGVLHNIKPMRIRDLVVTRSIDLSVHW